MSKTEEAVLANAGGAARAIVSSDLSDRITSSCSIIVFDQNCV
jgi:hypothetical protein